LLTSMLRSHLAAEKANHNFHTTPGCAFGLCLLEETSESGKPNPNTRHIDLTRQREFAQRLVLIVIPGNS